MDMQTKEGRCTAICWIAGAIVAILAYVLMRPGLWIIVAALLALILGVVVAVILQRQFCVSGGDPVERDERSDDAVAPPAAAPAPRTSDSQVASGSTRTAQAANGDAPPATPATKPGGDADPGAPGAAEVEAKPRVAVPEDEETAEWDEAQEGTSTAATSASAVDDSSGIRPEGLDAPRGGQADDLKKIKGVGPKLEEQLNDLGIYHYDQIAGWGAPQVAWMDENLKGFRGRVSRDDWVAQAAALAAGKPQG